MRIYTDPSSRGGRAVVIDIINTPFVHSFMRKYNRKNLPFVSMALEVDTVVDNYESVGFRLKESFDIFMTASHREDVEDFSSSAFFRSIPRRERQVFANEMFFLVFEKPVSDRGGK
ncbi:MAG: hypothetical protein GF409_05395 [Candidatus Omnitrophica bacterium]|nr:hypothetical protein [Candidatus Omnitrophota bacterium]